MAGPKTRKWTCARCSHYRWCEDFGGSSANDLDDDSVCDFCVLEERLLSELRSQAERFQTQLKEMETAHQAQLRKMETALKAALHSSEEEHGSLEEKSKKKNKKKKTRNLERPGGSSGTVATGDALPDGSPGASALEDVSSVGSISAAAVVDESSDKSSGAGDSGYVSFGAPIDDKTTLENSPRGEESSTVEAVKEASDGGASEDRPWKLVTSKKKKKTTKKEKENSVGVSIPRHGVHGNLFGDSQVKGIHSHLNKSGMRGVRVTSLPGKGNKDIRREVEKSTPDKSGVAIIIASGNDLYLRHGSVGNTSPIIHDVMGAVDDAALKTHRRVVVGIIPRLRWSHVAYSKNIGINNSLKYLCHKEGVTFVDPYEEFFGRPDLFRKDGVHLSEKGRAKLVTLVKRGCSQAGIDSGNSKKQQQHGVQKKKDDSSRTVRQEVGDSDSRGSGNGSS